MAASPAKWSILTALGISSPTFTPLKCRRAHASPSAALPSTASDTYGDVEAGGVLAIVGSTGKLEISINRGSAAKKLFVSRGDPVRVDV